MAEQPIGIIASVVEVVKGLTLTNVLVILLLIIGMAPAYLAWRILNDEELRDIVFSSFSTLVIAGSDCNVHQASEIGEDKSWFISHNFAFAGHDRWYVGVNILTEPSPSDIKAYCDTLSQTIIYARNRTIPKPAFPNDNERAIEVKP